MLTFLDKLTSYIAPHECIACGIEGTLLCSVCLPLLPEIQPQCYRCNRTDSGFKTCHTCRKSSALEYIWIRTPYESFSEFLIRQLKFQHTVSAAETIAQSITDHFNFNLPGKTVLLPVPTATSRVRQRGYDQSILIAKQLAKKTKLPCSRVLIRHGQQRQTGKSRAQRLVQLQNAFQVNYSKLGSIEHVILVDDVITTGATLEVAARALKEAGVKKISAVVFARSI